MNSRGSIPAALQIVAVLFLLYGISCLIGTVVRLASGSIHIDLGILGIPTFFGLRRFSAGWRTFALVCIWIGLIVCPVAFVLGLVGDADADLKLFGVSITPIELSVVSIPVFLLNFWQYRVLTRPQIRALFFASPDATNVA